MQNAVKHLVEADEEESYTPQKEWLKTTKKNILADFSACMYEYEDEAIFQEAFNILRTKASKQSWLDSVYKVKEKWAECYMTNVYTLGMRSTKLSGSLNSDLKRHFNIIRFLKYFGRVVEYKRNNELHAEYQSRKKLP